MNKATLCLIGLFISANSFAQSTLVDQGKTPVSTNQLKNTRESIKKPFTVKPFTIKPSKGDTIEKVSIKEYKEKVKTVDKIPDFVKAQESKLAKAPSPVLNGKEKVFPSNITNFTAEDIKNDPTLQKGKVFYIKQDVKPPISTLDEYNQRREQFLKRKEEVRKATMERIATNKENAQRAEQMMRLKDEYRRKMGLPISRFENTQGPNHNEAGITREMMGALSSGPNKLPAVPPTGNIQSVPKQ